MDIASQILAELGFESQDTFGHKGAGNGKEDETNLEMGLGGLNSYITFFFD